MLAKRYRLPLQSVPRGGAQFRSPLFAIRVLAAKLPYARFGVVVGTAVDKRAVVRNRVRRLAFTVCGTLKLSPPRDIVIVIQKTAATRTNDQFRESLKKALAAALVTSNQEPATRV